MVFTRVLKYGTLHQGDTGFLSNLPERMETLSACRTCEPDFAVPKSALILVLGPVLGLVLVGRKAVPQKVGSLPCLPEPINETFEVIVG